MIRYYPGSQVNDGGMMQDYSALARPRYPDSGDGTYSGWDYPSFRACNNSGDGKLRVARQVEFSTQSALNAYIAQEIDFITQSELPAYRNYTVQVTTQSALNAYAAHNSRFDSQSSLPIYANYGGDFSTQSALNTYQAQRTVFNAQSGLAAYVIAQGHFNGQSALPVYSTWSGDFNAQSGLNAYSPNYALFNAQSALSVYLERYTAFTTQSALAVYGVNLSTFGSQSALNAYATQTGAFTTESALAAYTASFCEFTTQSALDATAKFYAWLMNLQTGAVSKADNYSFNSLSGGCGADATGIHGLYGTTDNGAPINGFVESGKITLSPGSNLTRAVDAYVGVDGGKLKLSLTDELTGTNGYNLAATTKLMTVKANLGRKCKSKYWVIKIENVNGSKTNIDSIEINAETLQRRV